MRSVVGAHSAELIELIANAKAAINVKYNDVLAMHTASKSALSKVLTLVDASTLSRWALAVVDNAVKAAVAPGGMLAECIGKEVTLAVINAVDCIVAREINPRVHETLDNVFTSYWDCVLMERHLAETELKTYFQAQQELARGGFIPVTWIPLNVGGLHQLTLLPWALPWAHSLIPRSTRYEQDAYSYASTIYKRDAYSYAEMRTHTHPQYTSKMHTHTPRCVLIRIHDIRARCVLMRIYIYERK